MTIETLPAENDESIYSVDEIQAMMTRRYGRHMELRPVVKSGTDTVVGEKRIAIMPEAEALWPQRVLGLILEIRKVEETRGECVLKEHFRRVARVVSDPIWLCQDELKVLDSLGKTMPIFWPAFGYLHEDTITEVSLGAHDKHAQLLKPATARTFVAEARYWIDNWGVKPEDIATWLDMLRGVSAIDPLFFRHFLESDGFVRKRFEGIQGLNNGSKEVNESGEKVVFTRNTLMQVCDFAARIASEIDTISTTEPLEYSKLKPIRDSAERLFRFVELFKARDFAETRLERPSSIHNILTVIAASIAETYSENDTISERAISELAERMVSTLVKRRVNIEEIDLLCRMLATDCTDPNTQSTPLYIEQLLPKKDNPERIVRVINPEFGLQDRILAFLPYNKNAFNILKDVSARLLSRFVLQLRKTGLAKFDQKNYDKLGLDVAIYNSHTREVTRLETQPFLKVADITDRKNIIIEFSTQGAPFHHGPMLRDLYRLPKHMLRYLGFDWEQNGTGSRIIVALRVNRNPYKVDYPDRVIRKEMAAVSMADCSSKMVLYPADDIDAPTDVRIRAHQERYRNQGVERMARFCGADDLENPEYQSEKAFLRNFPHIITLQATDSESLQDILDSAADIFAVFKNKAIVCIQPNQDIHSRALRRKLESRDISRGALMTLVNPKIVEDVLKYWEGITPNSG